MRKLALAAVALASAGPAYAADVPLKAPPPPMAALPMAAPAFSWTGFYLGGTLGADTVKSNEGWTIDPVLNVDVPAAIAAREALSAQTLKATSVFGGPEVGYNLQYGMVVFGVEGDINWGSASTTSFFPSLAPLFLVPGNDLTEGVDLNWLATVRGRVGLAWNQFLIYGTGGYAAGGVRFFDSSHYAAGVTETADVSKTMSGWVAGGGVEWAFAGNWSVKGEYLHADLGSATTFSSLLPAFRVGFSHAHSVTVDVARAGLNYKF